MFDDLPSRPEIHVTAYRKSGTPEGSPISVTSNGYRMEFEYYPKSPVFDDSLALPCDFLLTDLAQRVLVISSQSTAEWPLSYIRQKLQQKYFPEASQNVVYGANEASAFIEELLRCFAGNWLRRSLLLLVRIRGRIVCK